MKRYRVKIAYFLLAVYLPMWLLASFHVHTHYSAYERIAHEQPDSDLDGDDCLLCQFQQLFYEEAQQGFVMVSLPEANLETASTKVFVLLAFEQGFLSRAPPVLL